jgi:hypothetical protein
MIRNGNVLAAAVNLGLDRQEAGDDMLICKAILRLETKGAVQLRN